LSCRALSRFRETSGFEVLKLNKVGPASSGPAGSKANSWLYFFYSQLKRHHVRARFRQGAQSAYHPHLHGPGRRAHGPSSPRRTSSGARSRKAYRSGPWGWPSLRRTRMPRGRRRRGSVLSRASWGAGSPINIRRSLALRARCRRAVAGGAPRTPALSLPFGLCVASVRARGAGIARFPPGSRCPASTDDGTRLLPCRRRHETAKLVAPPTWSSWGMCWTRGSAPAPAG
jgi:hypothetical protein